MTFFICAETAKDSIWLLHWRINWSNCLYFFSSTLFYGITCCWVCIWSPYSWRWLWWCRYARWSINAWSVLAWLNCSWSSVSLPNLGRDWVCPSRNVGHSRDSGWGCFFIMTCWMIAQKINARMKHRCPSCSARQQIFAASCAVFSLHHNTAREFGWSMIKAFSTFHWDFYSCQANLLLTLFIFRNRCCCFNFSMFDTSFCQRFKSDYYYVSKREDKTFYLKIFHNLCTLSQLRNEKLKPRTRDSIPNKNNGTFFSATLLPIPRWWSIPQRKLETRV